MTNALISAHSVQRTVIGLVKDNARKPAACEAPHHDESHAKCNGRGRKVNTHFALFMLAGEFFMIPLGSGLQTLLQRVGGRPVQCLPDG